MASLPDISQAAHEAVERLLTDYKELNPNTIEQLTEEPSALEFLRYVHRNRPFVIRGGAREWPAVRKWDAAYLEDVLGDVLVNVAVTPDGNADAPLDRDDGDMWFVKPHYQDMPFKELLRCIRRQEVGNEFGPVLYGQTQNDNLRGEYESLFNDVPPSIPFARIALEKRDSPGTRLDAVNFWLGNSKSVTAMHKDPYENLYVQIRGQKHFTLLPPIAAPCVNEQPLAAATYVPIGNPDTTSDCALPTMLEAQLDDPVDRPTVRFVTWDPEHPDRNGTPFSHLCRPLKVTLEPGDILYLPALWYHRVSQSCAEEGFCCAVNYWYDMEYTGAFFPTCSFVQEMGKLLARVRGTS